MLRGRQLQCMASRSSTILRRCAASTTSTTNTTHFGFKTVPVDEKESRVGEVFHRVAEKYDVMNDVMSGTMHRLWKDEFVNMLALSSTFPLQVLDVAGGTGDIAFRIHEAMGRTGHVTVCDINQSMLEVGEKRAKDRNLNAEGLSWMHGNAEVLVDVTDSSMDAYTIAFGIRNVTHIDRALASAFRVLKPGGRFMCLEFSKLETETLQTVYDQYSMHVIPKMGEVVSGDRDSYQYLVESIRRFPDQATFAQMIEAAGFRCVTYTNFTGGVVAVHSAFKL